MKNVAAIVTAIFFTLCFRTSYALDDIAFIVDGSGSIDSRDWALQKDGFVAALQNEAYVPRDGTIAIAVVQFSTPSPRVEVPLTVINSKADVDNLVAAIQAIVQIGDSTNPGDGIALANDLFTSSAREGASQTFCMSTDGLVNSGQSPTTAINAAKAATFGLDRFGVIAIEDGFGALESDFQRAYNSLVFGGGAVFVVQNTAEFANTVGAVCFPNIDVELVGLEVVQVVQDLENSVALVEDKATLVRSYIQPVDPAQTGNIQVSLSQQR